MKAISIKEPWASMIADGEKTIETRTWNTKYRGLLLIVVSKKPVSENSGRAIAVVQMTDCRVMTEEDEKFARCPIYERAKSWVFSDVKRIRPFDVKGQLGIYNVDTEIEYV